MARLRDLIRREPKRGLALPPWLDRLVSTGLVSRDRQVVRRQRCVNVAAYAGIASGLSYIVITSLYDLRGLWLLEHLQCGADRCGLFCCFGIGSASFVAIALILIIGFVQLYTIWMLGITVDLHIYYLLAGAVLFFFGVQNWKWFLGFFIYALVLLLFALNCAPVDGMLLPTDGRCAIDFQLPGDGMHHQRGADLLCAHAGEQDAELELEQQHERSEALIATVMPDTIAARLKSSETRIVGTASSS